MKGVVVHEGAPHSRLPVAGPWITERETSYVADAAANAWYSRAGDYNLRFERAFAEYVGRRFAVALPSCTTAIHLALAGLGVGPGDEVVVPDVTWIATAAPIVHLGATPIFADVDPETWCVTPKTVEAVLSPRTRAVIAVDLYGGTPAYEELEPLLEARGIPLVEDAAEAIGSARGARRAGSFGLASTFSFHGSKTMTTGEGGMLVTDDEHLHARALSLRDHGRAPGPITFECDEIGFKYRMTAMQAAMGLAQLERIDELVAKKRALFARYAERLAHAPSIRLNVEPEGTTNSFWMTTLIAPGVRKSDLARALDRAGIDSRPFFPPLSGQRAFAESRDAPRAQDANGVAYALAPWGVNLPSALSLEDADVDRVAEIVLSTLAVRTEAA